MVPQLRQPKPSQEPAPFIQKDFWTCLIRQPQCQIITRVLPVKVERILTPSLQYPTESNLPGFCRGKALFESIDKALVVLVKQ